MTASAETGSGTVARGRWWRRLLVVVAAVVAALAVYLIAELVTDGGVQTPAMESTNQESMTLNAGAVVLSSGLVSLVAWALLAVLEKLTRRGRLIWTIVAVVVFLLSLSAPFSGTDTTTGERLWLALMHTVVAAVLIPLLPAVARGRTPQPQQSG